MSTKNMWWVKKKVEQTTKYNEEVLNLDDLVNVKDSPGSPVDIQSIIEEINRESALSPLGPFDESKENLSIDALLSEAKRIYEESSTSFDQLSQKSKTVEGLTPSNVISKESSRQGSNSVTVSHSIQTSVGSYSDNFASEAKDISNETSENISDIENAVEITKPDNDNKINTGDNVEDAATEADIDANSNVFSDHGIDDNIDVLPGVQVFSDHAVDNVDIHPDVTHLLQENKALSNQIHILKVELEKADRLLNATEENKNDTSELTIKLQRCLEDLKESEERKTSVQLQLEALSIDHKDLKQSHDELTLVNKTLENRVYELDCLVNKYKTELVKSQENERKLIESEALLRKTLETERNQNKNLKSQCGKDEKCILDLNRQIKEMERILSRKHPDSVSALMVTAKHEISEQDFTVKKVLEDRIKTLQQEVIEKDIQSSKVFLDIQEKFVYMKSKYESHIQDLELHVSDLKSQLKQKKDTYDVYSQTEFDDREPPQRCTSTVATQTAKLNYKVPRNQSNNINNNKNMAKSINEPEKDPPEIKSDINTVKAGDTNANCLSVGDFQSIKAEKEKILKHLYRLEDDYQVLKNKRLNDLNILQEAHEREVQSYVSNINLLHEQIQMQQVSIATLQKQLSSLQSEMSILTTERNHLNKCYVDIMTTAQNPSDTDEVLSLKRQLSALERKYEEREHRLQAVVEGLAQKNIRNINCDQCSKRQKQLIEYKIELEKLLATLETLQ